MWREYFGFAGTAVAVINGIIAMVVALMPVRRSVLKLRLGVVAIALAVLAIGAASYAKYRTFIQVERQQAERSDARTQLSAFLTEGRELLGQIRNAKRALPTTAADEWALRTETYLRDKLGEQYIERFRKDAHELYGDDAAVAAPRMAYWRAVRNRVVNLEMIGAQFLGQP
jgi:hypothetical protein